MVVLFSEVDSAPDHDKLHVTYSNRTVLNVLTYSVTFILCRYSEEANKIVRTYMYIYLMPTDFTSNSASQTLMTLPAHSLCFPAAYNNNIRHQPISAACTYSY